MDVELITALQCAIAELEGTAGGYTQEEKYRAKIKLMEHVSQLEHWTNGK